MNTAVTLTLVLLAGCATAAQPPTPAAPFIWPTDDIVVADSTIGQIPRRRNAPEYPLHERMNGGEAAFLTAFILDSAGSVVLPSVAFLGEAPPAFVSAVCAYYRRVQYAPARVGGVPTAALVVVPFVFALEGGKMENRRIDDRAVREHFQQEGAKAAITELQKLPHCSTN